MASACPGLPTLQGRTASHLHQAIEQFTQRLGGGDELGIVVAQQGVPRRVIGVDAHTQAVLAHALQQCRWHAHRTDAGALAFDEDRPRGIKALQCLPQQGVEALLRWLRLARHGAEDGPAVAGQAFEVEHLRTLCRQRLQQPRLAAARAAAQHDEVKRQRLRFKLGTHELAEGAVAAGELPGAKADGRQDGRQRARTLPAAPAVDERAPLARLVAR